MEAHPPVVGLVAGEAGAVDAGLLAGAEADDLPVEGVADGIGLGVFEGDGGDGEVAEGGVGQGAGVFGDDDGGEGVFRGDLDVVAVLLEVDAVDGAGFDGCGVVGVVDLEDEVFAAFLLREDVEGLGGVGGCDDAVGDFARDDLGGDGVDLVGEGDHVAEAGHTVCAAGAGVGLCEAGVLESFNVVDHVHFAFLLVQRDPDGCPGGGDVLEACRRGEVESLAELFHQRPCVQRIEQVDEAG